ncbi:trifunctional transcriptional regulator/proline dehydrogenase/L-glutamate gamma-semialdehyde dehydrogenase [Uliginosibacterium sp. H3]|uniref:Bifunctional protein PutA n=1 Tax=Uliginosibacterium silvisoli TaxID=3114758 RepID=A0ABU6K0A6_9RHOO|nr:trifunctional transcriptional regulator/proline dehydrogenase/L-glutamate gamma-semialdehyde dehydrogenase [Uliginosibacterium sp. H3]
MATTTPGAGLDDAARQGADEAGNKAASQPEVFRDFAASVLPQSALRAAITFAWRRPEPEMIPMLADLARLPEDMRLPVQRLARQLTERLRKHKSGGFRSGMVQGLLQEFSLSSQEGIALMCLAEALLRIPDAATRDALIRDKIGGSNWQTHLGHSSSLFVNAATWGLLLTGKLVATHNEAGLGASLNRIIGKSGEPLVRKGVDMAMRLMGEQFVTGETIVEALANGVAHEARGFRYSYDMLGEAALTDADAQRYLAAYEQAIHAIGKASNGRGIHAGPGISVKLSALQPRFGRARHERAMNELYPRLLSLVTLARQYDIGLNIDAEEADRLEVSLDLIERLCFEPALADWNGIGFVVQAYQKRCPFVIDHLIDLARRSRRRLMIRLVKGAYWDSEIKLAQVQGMQGYPVYTRKVYTDISYLACARKLLAVPEAIYPQFATHNAHTLAAIHHMAGQRYYAGQYEFQCLHGMGEPLYEQVIGPTSEGGLDRPCRIYAPVGTHETLLPYLVRRLLENGANTSFVNRVADPECSLDALVADPLEVAERLGEQEGQTGLPHPDIPLPPALYGDGRVNAAGMDLANEQSLAALSTALLESTHANWRAAPLLGCSMPERTPWQVITNPADRRDIVGHVLDADTAEVSAALQCSVKAWPTWRAIAPALRAGILRQAAGRMEGQMPRLMGLLVREAGKSLPNAVGEVREAVDFLRFYAAQIDADFANDSHHPLGPVVCISPWNFPLAIFTGQVAAALAAGNTVLAKPAEQTPLVAAEAVRILLQAGVPAGVLQLLPGPGETVGAQLTADERVRGVMFTGSTAVARLLQESIAGRLDAQGRNVPLIAETGGLNAMIVDSSAQTEQVVNDVMASAFDSAGQRCSALRLLCLQEDVAEHMLANLRGAMAEYRLGCPERLDVDIGPVIDAEAQAGIERHIEQMRAGGRAVFQAARSVSDERAYGSFVMPTLIELKHVSDLQHEVFGPVLHVLRYRREDLGELVTQINATGYGLTLGVHSRIDETIARVVEHARVGNVYVNRNMVGAVVGVQPFGGEGLSGTGPKAGGPLYLYRLLSARPAAAVSSVFRRDDNRANASREPALKPLAQFREWAASVGDTRLATLCTDFAQRSLLDYTRQLRGPTGERNTYRLAPRRLVLCLATDEGDLLVEIAATLSVGAHAMALKEGPAATLAQRLPPALRAYLALATDFEAAARAADVALCHGDAGLLGEVARRLADQPGAILPLHGLPPGDTAVPLEWLLVERSLSVNTAAAGGNATLMTTG